MSAKFSVKRICLPAKRHYADANLRKRYPIEDAAWIWLAGTAAAESAGERYDADTPWSWHDGGKPSGITVARFRRAWTSAAAEQAVFHVSADERYKLYLDGELISLGPDRCDESHWAFASLSLEIPAGAHVLEAEVWWMPHGIAPDAQHTIRPGFIFKAEGTAENLDTGAPGWVCARRRGLAQRTDAFTGDARNYLPPLNSGASFVVDAAAWCAPLDYSVEPAVVASYWNSEYGIVMPDWRFEASPLPEQKHDAVAPGTVRAVFTGGAETLVPAGCDAAAIAQWQKLIAEENPVTVAPHRELNVIWDLGDYYCGFPHVAVSGGKGASLSYDWAESLYQLPLHLEWLSATPKGNRDEIVGKCFIAFGDSLLAGGGEAEFEGAWWRSGRYVRIRVCTGDEPLTVEKIDFYETRLPLENEGGFSATPSKLDEVVKLAVRGIQMCAHETFMDCPYYEQLQYVGDGRLQLLVYYMLTGDLALPRRAIQLLAWSTRETGFVAERYPGCPLQLSLTFSMFWVMIVRDYVYWRDDLDWVKANLLTPLRGVMEHFIELLADRYLIGPETPGWSFVDWVKGWDYGNTPTSDKGPTATMNFLLSRAFFAAAEVEEAVGDMSMSYRYHDLGDAILDAANDMFWCEEKGLYSEDPGHTVFTEHAQCIGLNPEHCSGSEHLDALFEKMAKEDIARTTVYFSFYLLELYHDFDGVTSFDTAGAFYRRLQFWEELPGQGFKTPVEQPEPSRSDCHAWGSHPLFHMNASIAGIRPDKPGFRSVIIKPMFGLPYKKVTSRIPHPKGFVAFSWEKKANGKIAVSAELPPGVKGTLVYGENTMELIGKSQHLITVSR